MKTKEQMRAEYEHRSEIISHGLRRDAWQSIAIALELNGQISLCKDIYEFLESKGEN